jgi:hypothetical protein
MTKPFRCSLNLARVFERGARAAYARIQLHCPLCWAAAEMAASAAKSRAKPTPRLVRLDGKVRESAVDNVEEERSCRTITLAVAASGQVPLGRAELSACADAFHCY